MNMIPHLKNLKILFNLPLLYALATNLDPAFGMEQNFLNEQGIERPHDFLNASCFDFIAPVVRKNNADDHRSNIYNYKVAKAPQFHPYHQFFFYNALFMHLPTELVALPEKVQEYLSRHTTFSKEDIDFFLVVQDNTKVNGQPLLYRPHYYTDQNIPENGIGDYNVSWQISVALFNLLPDETSAAHHRLFPKLSEVSLINSQGHRVSEASGTVCTHTADGLIVLSGPLEGGGIGLDGFENNRQSAAFWTSLIVRPDGQQQVEKVAVTLHILLGATSEDAMDTPPINRACNFLTSQHSPSAGQAAKYLDDNYFGYTFCGEKAQNQGYMTSILTQNKCFAGRPSPQPQVVVIPGECNGLIYIHMYGDLFEASKTMSAEAKKNWGRQHYFSNGAKEGRSYFPFGVFYVNKYEDLYNAFKHLDFISMEATGRQHYETNGRSEKRDFSFPKDFNGLTYVTKYQDLVKASQGYVDKDEKSVFGLMHYVSNGYREKRSYK